MEHERFAALVGPHAAAMARVAAALVGLADAEDAAQEALLRAWRWWPTLRESEAARAWLLRITVNVCRNWEAGRFGTRRRLTQPLIPDDTDADAHGCDPLATPGPGAPEHAAALDLRRAVAALPEEQRLVVVLKFYVGLDSHEIGAALDTPAATVRTRLRRALAALRDTLADPEAPRSSQTFQGGAAHG